jgi:hypothetical protein
MTATSDDAVLSKIEGALYPEEVTETEAQEPEEIQPEADTETGDQEDEVQAEADAEEEKSLAAALGLDEGQVDYDEDGNLVFNAKIDGQIQKIKARDALKQIQLEGHVNRKSMELSERQKELQAQAEQFQQQYSQKLEMANSVMGMMEQQLLDEFNNVNWEQLESADPGMYAAKRQRFGERAAALQRQKEQLESAYSEHQQSLQQQQMDTIRQIAERERQKLLEAYPEWSNPEVMKQETSNLKSFLMNSYGFGEAEANQIYDHRLVKIIKDAHAYRSAKTAVADKIKKPVPKFQKPGQQADNRKKKAEKEKFSRLKKTGSVRDVANILMDRL